MSKNVEIVYTTKFIEKFKKVLIKFYKYETYMDFIVMPFLWKKTLMYIPLLSYSDRKSDEIEDLLELSKDNDYQIRTLNFNYKNFKKDDMVTMRIDVKHIDKISSYFSSRTRNRIKKAEKEKFLFKKGNSDEMIEHFYQIYSKTMYYHGTPVLDKNFFYALRDEFQENIIFYNFYDGYKIIGGLCNLIDEEISIGEWMGIDNDYKNKNLGYFMFFKMIEDNVKKEIKIIDFGRSPYGGGTYQFKIRFNAYPVKIDIYQPHQEDIYQKYKFASFLWKQLPKNIADMLGAKLSKYLKDL